MPGISSRLLAFKGKKQAEEWTPARESDAAATLSATTTTNTKDATGYFTETNFQRNKKHSGVP